MVCPRDGRIQDCYPEQNGGNAERIDQASGRASERGFIAKDAKRGDQRQRDRASPAQELCRRNSGTGTKAEEEQREQQQKGGSVEAKQCAGDPPQSLKTGRDRYDAGRHYSGKGAVGKSDLGQVQASAREHPAHLGRTILIRLR